MQPSEYTNIDWHNHAWSRLWGQADSLPHALLLTGSDGIGVDHFALALAARLLCEAPTENQLACGNCPSCRWFASGNHPDFRYLQAEAELETNTDSGEERKRGSRYIVIDQVRALEDFVFVGGHRNGARVVLIEPADAMNLPAQNALLKILEEPPSSVYFILISYKWRRLLPTILSRCRQLPLPRPTAKEAQRWLTNKGAERVMDLLPFYGNAPLLAHREHERGRSAAINDLLMSLTDPSTNSLALAAKWQTTLQLKSDDGISLDTFIQILQLWLSEIATIKFAGKSRLASSWQQRATRLADGVCAMTVLRCYNDLMKFKALASHPLNPQLFLEDIAERYCRAVAKKAA